jgi:hypothetical protein
MWKIIHYGASICAKFHEKIRIKNKKFIPFLHCNVCDTLLQIKNVLQLIIEFFICAPISQHFDSLGFYPPLIAHFHKKNLLQIFF